MTFSDSQISKQYKDWLYPKMIQAIKNVVGNSITLVFSPTRLSNLVNYGWIRKSKADSGSKNGVQCKDSSIMYLAFIIRNLIIEFIKNNFRILIKNEKRRKLKFQWWIVKT